MEDYDYEMIESIRRTRHFSDFWEKKQKDDCFHKSAIREFILNEKREDKMKTDEKTKVAWLIRLIEARKVYRDMLGMCDEANDPYVLFLDELHANLLLFQKFLWHETYKDMEKAK